jgi:hypothetical protein
VRTPFEEPDCSLDAVIGFFSDDFLFFSHENGWTISGSVLLLRESMESLAM